MKRSSSRPPGSDTGDRELLGPGLIHELRQPLTALDAALRLVARELGPSVTTLDVWSMATGQVARLQETLDTFQQLMTGGAELGAFLVEPVVRRAIAAARARLDLLGDRFALVVDGDVPGAHGSAQALLHAVSNLVSNALDAVEQGGGGRIEVRVLRAPDGARAQVRVADEGIGILTADRERIFTVGYTTKARGKGSGLGLAIARRMLRAAGGELRLAAEADPARRPWASTELVVELAASAAQPVPVAPAMAAPRRRGLRVTLVGVALLAAAAAGWAGLRPSRTAGEAAAVIASAEAGEVVLESATGAIERLRPGGWEPVVAGERLREDDTIRTGAGAAATLAVGDRSRVAVSDATQLTVRELTAAVQRLRLSRGRISVDHQPDGARVLVVESDDGASVARANEARFSVLASGRSLAVATETGVVRLQAAGASVDVSAGRQAVAFRGAAPDPSRPIPPALLLKIARTARGEGVCTVSGVVDRGAEVRVEGRLVEVGGDGRFSVRLPARAAMRASVVIRDAAGHGAERQVPCAPIAPEQDVSDFAVRWGQDASARGHR
ncbi:ATP-binding protein [Anaeromyxobacter soli]|uniref:ATP-binding protein n=1 Tax=Anaeromyxobacter soli TaxID=2922725 RepID=UPI001FAF7DF0|nr:ATP-binding protein [Anaeromyxobacter sp. SG29]